jgi:hypothetical protein
MLLVDDAFSSTRVWPMVTVIVQVCCEGGSVMKTTSPFSPAQKDEQTA